MQPVDRDEAARHITESVTALFFSAENQARFHGAADELGISPPMLKALLELRPGDAMAMRDLAERWRQSCTIHVLTPHGRPIESPGRCRGRAATETARNAQDANAACATRGCATGITSAAARITSGTSH